MSAVPAVVVAVVLVPRNTLVLLPSSLMVPVPVAAAVLVTVPPVKVPALRLKVSLPS